MFEAGTINVDSYFSNTIVFENKKKRKCGIILQRAKIEAIKSPEVIDRITNEKKGN